MLDSPVLAVLITTMCPGHIRPTNAVNGTGPKARMQRCDVLQVVQDTVTDAVQEAVAAAFEENGRFDVRANFYTLIAITGVVLYWRGIWNSWLASLLLCLVLLQHLS